ncbi:MAG: AAA family ATPase [Cyclobacteriaceae bacterium]|nr:AAA family ATPase [Cyclobacteriaceae bacterium]
MARHIIGIGGVSRSGKTTLAHQLKAYMEDSGLSVRVLCQDDFVLAEDDLPYVGEHVDWETPESMDWDALLRALIRSSEACDICIVEGIFAFHCKRINDYYTITVNLELEKEVFLERKKQDLRWGAEPDWYIAHIWKSHLKYRQIPAGCLKVRDAGLANPEKLARQLGLV